MLQQVEHFNNPGITANDAFKPVTRYFDRITRPEQIISSLQEAMRVLTNPEKTGAVTICLPQDVQAEAYNYPENFFQKKVWSIERNVPSENSLAKAASLIKKSSRPLIIAGGGIIYSDAENMLSAFCKNSGIPITETQAGKGSLPWDHNCLLYTSDAADE